MRGSKCLGMGLAAALVVGWGCGSGAPSVSSSRDEGP